jgi:hypothetical protein
MTHSEELSTKDKVAVFNGVSSDKTSMVIVLIVSQVLLFLFRTPIRNVK